MSVFRDDATPDAGKFYKDTYLRCLYPDSKILTGRVIWPAGCGFDQHDLQDHILFSRCRRSYNNGTLLLPGEKRRSIRPWRANEQMWLHAQSILPAVLPWHTPDMRSTTTSPFSGTRSNGAAYARNPLGTLVSTLV